MNPADPSTLELSGVAATFFASLPLPLLAASFLLGLASGVHCVGMCGGILAAFASAAPRTAAPQRRHEPASGLAVRIEFPAGGFPAAPVGPAQWQLQAGYNAGRVGAYTLAGAAAGAVGSAGAYAAGVAQAQVVLYAVANLMLVLIGLHLAGASALLARLESIGRPVWRRLQPVAARVLPARSVPQALLAGSLWGWLPCGLVYAMLVTAVASGSAAHGALAMLAFGVGTAPHMMLAGLALARLRRLLASRGARLAAGTLVLSFGLIGLARAADIGDTLRRLLLCL